MWVANANDNTVSKVDLSQDPPRQTKTVTVANYPYEVTYGAGKAVKAWCASEKKLDTAELKRVYEEERAAEWHRVAGTPPPSDR